MRKHFLILMLMALLPLAGWADDAVDLPSNLAVTFTDMTYNGEDQTANVAIATAKAGGTSVLGKVAIEGKYADAACTNPATVKNAGTYYIRIKGDGTNYKADSYKVFNLVVAKFGDIHVTAVALPKIYGQAYPTTGYYTATMPAGAPAADREGAAAPYAPSAAVGLVVTPSYSTWALNKAAGVHQFEITTNTVANYNIVVEEQYANLTINKANLTVKAKDLIGTSAVEYGTTPVYGVTYGSNLYPGDDANFGKPTYTVKNAVDKTFEQAKGAVGNYTITPSGLVSSNYNFVYETGTLTVTARNISHVTFVMAGSTYDSADQLAKLQKFTATDDGAIASPAVGPQTSDFTVEIFEAATGGSALTTVTQAGKYYAEIKSAGKNYTGDAAARLEVILAKKQLNIVTVDKTKDYDGASFPITNTAWSSVKQYISFDGLEVADATTDGYAAGAAYITGSFLNNIQVSLSTPGAANAGEYTINVSSTKAKDKIFKNYVANFVNVGIATINKAKITLKPTDVILQYGDTEPDWATVDETAFDITGILGTEDVDDVFETLPTINRVIPAGKTAGDVGTYDLIATGYALLNPCNYEFKEGEPKKGTLTIQAATSITVKVDNVNAVYGEYADVAALKAAGKLKYRISGVKAEDKDKVTVDLTVDDNNPVPAKRKAYAGKRGTYTIRIGAVTLDESIADNYAGVSITKMDGTLTVGKAPLTLKVLNQSLVADDVDGQALAAASEQTVEILTEGLSDADKTALFTTTATKISLKYSNKLVSATDYDATTLVLKSNALTHGWNGSAATTDGIYVNGIEIDATNYNGADVNYTLVLTGEDATVTPGTLYLSNGAYVTFDATATGANLVSTKLAANNNKTIGVKVILRRDQTVGGNTVTWSAKQWNTMVLPFDISVADLSAALGYAIVNVVKPEATTGDKVKFQLEMDEIPANTPFAVKTTKAIANNQVIDFGLQTIKYEANPAVGAGADNIFHGAYTSMDITSANPEYRFCAGNVWPHISEAGSKFVVRPFNAYMEIDAANLARDIVFEFEELDGSTTSIKSVDFGSSKAYEADGWYTINGMKLNAAPTEKGIYINNGKKVVVK